MVKLLSMYCSHAGTTPLSILLPGLANVGQRFMQKCSFFSVVGATTQVLTKM